MKTLKNFIPLLLFVALFALITQIPRAWGQDPPKCIPGIEATDNITAIGFPDSIPFSEFQPGDWLFSYYVDDGGNNVIVGADIWNSNHGQGVIDGKKGTIFPAYLDESQNPTKPLLKSGLYFGEQCYLDLCRNCKFYRLDIGELYGSSGVGKSTLLNNLSGKALMKTDSISVSTKKGRHITSHRELIILENGGILIDNPGMREVGIADTTSGLEITFNAIIELSQNKKRKNSFRINCYGETQKGQGFRKDD